MIDLFENDTQEFRTRVLEIFSTYSKNNLFIFSLEEMTTSPVNITCEMYVAAFDREMWLEYLKRDQIQASMLQESVTDDVFKRYLADPELFRQDVMQLKMDAAAVSLLAGFLKNFETQEKWDGMTHRQCQLLDKLLQGSYLTENHPGKLR